MELQIGKYTVEIGRSYDLDHSTFYTMQVHKNKKCIFDRDFEEEYSTEFAALTKALEVIKEDSEIKETIWIDGKKIEYIYDPVENRHLIKSGDVRFIGATKLSVLDQFFKQ